MNEELYDDWYSDNRKALIGDFIEDNYDEYTKFCDEEFKKWMDER